MKRFELPCRLDKRNPYQELLQRLRTIYHTRFHFPRRQLDLDLWWLPWAYFYNLLMSMGQGRPNLKKIWNLSYSVFMEYTWDGWVPCSETLWMLGCNTESGTIWSTENNWTTTSTCRHVQCLCSRIYDLINSLHWEIVSHEFTNWFHSTASESGTDCHTGKTHLKSV